MDEPFKVAMSS